jgi:hypothetical protein
MANATADRQRPSRDEPEIRESEDQAPEQRSEEEQAVIKATEGEALTPKEAQKATDWFLSDEPEPPTILYFDVNVAAAGRPAHYIRWGVRSLQRHEIKAIRQQATDPNTGIEDDMETNMRVVIAASVDPDFQNNEQVRRGYADPADLLNRRFAHKPGIIEAIARKCNEMAGYGVGQIIRPVDAAGN